MEDLLEFLKHRLSGMLSAITSFQLDQIPPIPQIPNQNETTLGNIDNDDVNVDDIYANDDVAHDARATSSKCHRRTARRKPARTSSNPVLVAKKKKKSYQCKHCPKLYASRQSRHHHMKRKHNGTINPETRVMSIYTGATAARDFEDSSSASTTSRYDEMFD